MTRQALLFSVALLVGPQPVLAQNLGSAPKGGVFGDADTAARSRLDLTVALSEALDSEVPPELRPVLPQGGPQSGGYSSMLTASADYERIRRRAQVAASGVTTLRHYQQLDQVSVASHSAALGATMRLPRRATFEVNLTGAYSPSYFYSLFPAVAPPELGEAVPPAQDYRVDDQQSFSYTSTSDLRCRVHPRQPRQHDCRAQPDRFPAGGMSAPRPRYPHWAREMVAWGWPNGRALGRVRIPGG